MKKLAFTTAIALALSTAAYAAGPQHSGGPSGGMGGPSGFSGAAPGGSGGPGFSGVKGGPGGPGGPGYSGTMKGAPGGLYSQGNIKSFNQGGPYKQGGPGRDYDLDRGHHLMNRADHDHDFDRDRHGEGGRDFDHRGVVRGNFFEHGRHFGFRRFWHGQWVFLNGWDDCTAYVWVHVAPGTWAWAPVDICVG